LVVVGFSSGRSQIKVLLVGNSQLGVYDTINGKRIYDLSRMLEDISESAPPDFPRIKSDMARGRTLKVHWEKGDGPGTTRAMIATGNWDYVVIQEIYRLNEEDFKTCAKRFDEAIEQAGAKTILFATAHVANPDNPYYKPYPDAFEKLNDIQVSYGKEMGIPVATAGYAWMKYLGPDPAEEQILDLYHPDRAHPGYKGSYIYACLLYSVITGKSPVGLTGAFNIDSGIMDSIRIDEKEALRMQRAAWDQYLEMIPPDQIK
jgi:hypothetical protein